MTIANDRVMIPTLVWSSTVYFLLIPAPPNATSVSVSKNGTPVINLYAGLDNMIRTTVTEVEMWTNVEGGYAKVKVTHNGSSSLKPGPAIAYVIGSGTLTVTFQ